MSRDVWCGVYSEGIGFKNVKPNSSFHRLKGPRILEEDYGLLSTCSWFSTRGEGYIKKGESYWCLETFSDSDWSGNKSERKSTSGGFHALNSCPLFNSSRTQKIISLSSCEAGLRATVSSASGGIYIRSVLEFALGTKVGHYIFADSSSARQLVMKRGVGKVRHLDGKLLWIQSRKDFNMLQV